MKTPLRITIFTIFFTASVALAQDAPPKDLPQLGLSPSQKQTIYISMSNQPDKKSVAPSTFRATPGAHVPDMVKVEPMSKTIVELMPQTKGYEIAFVATQVLIIEPKSKRVVEIINAEPQ